MTILPISKSAQIVRYDGVNFFLIDVLQFATEQVLYQCLAEAEKLTAISDIHNL